MKDSTLTKKFTVEISCCDLVGLIIPEPHMGIHLLFLHFCV